MSGDEIEIPQNNKYADSKRQDAKRKIETAFGEFKALLNDKIHPDNQTAAFHKNVIATLNRLLSAANEHDEISPGEGIFGLIILSLRSILKLKDDNIRLEHKIRDLEKEVNKIRKMQK